MPYLLDTNHCSYIMNGGRKQPQYRKPQEVNTLGKYQAITSETVYMCEVSLSELFMGAEKSPHSIDIHQRIRNFRSIIPCLSVTSTCWELHGKTKWEIKKNGGDIKDFDLLIACIAKEYGCVLVTNDSNFKNLPPGFVQIENWAV